ncbi:MAG: HNH endonuclease [Nitrospirae bacterium]|nr:HNH endonuclease [Nitrospirota bacterium]
MTLEIEHFEPHCNNNELKFKWENLFLSCRHCNSTKSDRYNTNDYTNILNCTDSQHDVVSWIKYDYDADYEFIVRLTTNTYDDLWRKTVDNTVEILTYVYYGKTITQKLQTTKLRNLSLLQKYMLCKI